MSSAFAVFVSLTLASHAVGDERDLDDESMRFANTLVAAYNCELLGYGVDYVGLADWGHEMRQAIMAQGATDEEALERIQSEVRFVRDRFNARYYSAIFYGGEAQGRYQRTFTKKCNALADNQDTASFFNKPEGRLSHAGLRRKIGYPVLRPED